MMPESNKPLNEIALIAECALACITNSAVKSIASWHTAHTEGFLFRRLKGISTKNYQGYKSYKGIKMIINIKRWGLLVLVATLLSFTSNVIACESKAYSSQVYIVYVDDFSVGSNAGQIVKQRVDYLKGIMTGAAFEEISEISTSVSAYVEQDEITSLIISLNASYTGSYEAVSQLINSKEHISIDISQCQFE